MGQKIVFNIEQMNCFRRISYDENPLHCDSTYTASTSFQQLVVYGMASTIYVLGQWLQGRSIILREAKCTFKKPIFLNTAYELKIEELPGKAVLSLFKGSVLYQKFTFGFQEKTDEDSVKQVTSPRIERSTFRPLTNPRDGGSIDRCGKAYAMHQEALKNFEELFHVGSEQIPLDQLEVFFWASYFVGMELPGRQALFSAASFEFHPPSEPKPLRLHYENYRHDERFNLYSINGAGGCLKTFSVQAFRRPEPVQMSWERAFESVNPRLLHDKNVFITGASRGFGLAMAGVFSMSGACVLANYRRKSDGLETLAKSLLPPHGPIIPMLGNLEDDLDCKAMADNLQKRNGADFLILNASPAIPSLLFSEQSAKEWLDYLISSIGLHVKPLMYIMPTMQRGSAVIHISTTYLTDSPSGYTHYLALKQGVTGLLKGLSKEYPGIYFLDVLLPRMLTDQTNGVFNKEKNQNPQDVAVKLVHLVGAEMNRQPSYRLIEIDSE